MYTETKQKHARQKEKKDDSSLLILDILFLMYDID